MQMISRKNKERLKNGSIPVFLGIFGLLAFSLQPELNSGIPSYSSLRHANGLVSSVSHSLGESTFVEFNLRGIAHPIIYDPLSKKAGLVRSALDKAMLEQKPIDILYEIHHFTIFFGIEKENYHVWQLKIDGETIKTYDDLSTANEKDNRLGQIVCQIIGGFLLLLSFAKGIAFLKKEFGRKQY